MPGAAAVHKKAGGWRCFENQCKQTQKKSILREKRVDAESCYLWFLRTYLFSHVLNIISINSRLNYVS